MADRPRQLHSWERFAALLAAAVAVALNIAASVQLFVPQTTFGYRLVYTSGFEVAGVDAGTPAAAAGIATGDHLDFSRSKLRDRLIGLEYQPALPGEPVSFVLIHEPRQPRPLTLRAGPLTESQSQRALFSPLASFLRLAGFAYILVALAILLRRPNRMTWGLFIYLVSATDVSFYRFPDSLSLIVTLASDLLGVAGTAGLVIFAARFPEDRPTGWRAWADRLAIPAGALFVIPNLAWDAGSLIRGEGPQPWMAFGSTLGALGLLLVAGISLVGTFLTAERWERQRLQWVMTGVFFTLLAFASEWARYLPQTYPVVTSDAVMWLATLLYAAAPFAIAYGVVRQRVFDISFVISRTLVFTIVTALIFVLFALVEWLAGHLVEQTGITIALVAFTAIAVSFSLNAVHARVEHFVESTLFRRRHQAQHHLENVIAGLPYAQSAPAVEGAILREPMQAFTLSSATLFFRDSSGEYVRNDEVLDEAIPLRLEGAHHSVRLHEFDRDGAEEIEKGDPVLAVPIFVRSHLCAVVVYGAHVNGEDIDPDEAASLEALGVAAGIAYDHLETARVERDAERWRRFSERQARELAALRERIQKGPA
ncbi:MAG TPA: hypothetical protein VEW74_09460 [Candidatus Nitrosotalea sp.]|nr:hypothetical protein [Candidatus Nitrosotalea sp.]